MPNSRIHAPISSPEGWKRLLADPDKQWRTGFSAQTLALSWLAADGFPPEVATLFSSSGVVAFESVEPLIIIPEHQVRLPPEGGHPSQNDLFVLAKGSDGGLISMTVEGKVSESFDKPVGEWLKSASSGKLERLTFLAKKLGLSGEIPPTIRYQLLHRLASAVLEAERFGARHAVMIVHSFSQSDEWFSDFAGFVSLYNADAGVGKLAHLKHIGGMSIYAGWARGDPRFLDIPQPTSPGTGLA